MRLRLMLPLAIAASSLLLLIAAPAQAGTNQRMVIRALAAGGPHPLPVVGGRVTVLARGRIVGRGRTGSRGIAFLGARSGSGGLLLRVSGGTVGGRRYGGQMETFLRHYAWPRTAEVNSLTTLATRFAAARGVDQRKAARRVRGFLRLPRAFRLGLDGRTDFAFDGRRFLRAAGRGGYDALIARLLRSMATPGAHRSFRPRHHRHHPRTAARNRSLSMSGSAPGAAKIGEEISGGTGFFEALEDANYVLDFAKSVMELTGVGDNSVTAAELREVSAQLQKVEEEVAKLRAETQVLRSAIDSSTYGIKAERSLEFHEAIEAAEESLQTVLQAAEQAGCTKEPVGDPKQCEKEESLLESALETYGAEGPATFGKLRTYADYIAGYAAPEGGGIGEGLLQAASHLTTNGSGQSFYTAAESRDLASFAHYWLSNYAEGLVLAPLYADVKGEGPEAIKTAAEGIAPYAKALVAATPRQLAAGTVIDMADGTMWPTEASAIGTGEPWSWFVANGPWRYVDNAGEGPAWRSTRSGAEVPSIGSPPQASVPNEDWQVAGAEQIDSLLRAADPGPGQTPGEALLEDAGIQSGIVIPPYGGYDGEGLNEPVAPGRGVEMEYQYAGNLYEVEEGLHINSGCYRGKSSCFWPIWVGDGGTVANLNRLTPTYRYVQGTFEVSDPLDISWYGSPLWGYDDEGTLYGNDPVDNIPNLFFRSIGPAECYYYPAAGQAPGSPGCPQGQ